MCENLRKCAEIRVNVRKFTYINYLECALHNQQYPNTFIDINYEESKNIEHYFLFSQAYQSRYQLAGNTPKTVFLPKKHSLAKICLRMMLSFWQRWPIWDFQNHHTKFTKLLLTTLKSVKLRKMSTYPFPLMSKRQLVTSTICYSREI